MGTVRWNLARSFGALASHMLMNTPHTGRIYGSACIKPNLQTTSQTWSPNGLILCTLGHTIYLSSTRVTTPNPLCILVNRLVLQKRKQIRMHHVQRPTRLALLNHTTDVDLARPLTNHLDINPMLAQRAKKPPANTDHTPQLPAD